jgi:hypothetical protein
VRCATAAAHRMATQTATPHVRGVRCSPKSAAQVRKTRPHAEKEGAQQQSALQASTAPHARAMLVRTGDAHR